MREMFFEKMLSPFNCSQKFMTISLMFGKTLKIFKILFSNVKSTFGCLRPILTSKNWEKNVVYDTLKKNLQSMIPYLIDFVVILNIIWLKVVNCNRQVTMDKKSLHVQHDNFHPIIIKDKSYIMLRCHIIND